MSIQNNHIKYIQQFIADDIFGDYVRITLSNPNYYRKEDFDLKQYIIKAGYFDKDNNIEYLENMLKGYTLLSRIDTLKLPNEIEIDLMNRFYLLNLYKLETSFNGLKVSDAFGVLIDILNLNQDEVIVETTRWDDMIYSFDTKEASIFEIYKKITQAFNLIVYFNYDGKLVIKDRKRPSELPIACEINGDRAIFKEEYRPYKVPSQIIVKGKTLEWWEIQEEHHLGSYGPLAIPFWILYDPDFPDKEVQVVYNLYWQFVFYHQTTSSYCKRVVITPWYDPRGTNFWNYRIVYPGPNESWIDIMIKKELADEYVRRLKKYSTHWDAYFKVDLYGVVVSDETCKVKAEREDLELKNYYGAHITYEIDNELIQSHSIAQEILNYEWEVSRLWDEEVSVEIPFNPLIERFDKVRITFSDVNKNFDLYVTSIEHTFEPNSGKSKTILKGYKIT